MLPEYSGANINRNSNDTKKLDAERHFNTARTPKHCNRGLKIDTAAGSDIREQKRLIAKRPLIHDFPQMPQPSSLRLAAASTHYNNIAHQEAAYGSHHHAVDMYQRHSTRTAHFYNSPIHPSYERYDHYPSHHNQSHHLYHPHPREQGYVIPNGAEYYHSPHQHSLDYQKTHHHHHPIKELGNRGFSQTPTRSALHHPHRTSNLSNKLAPSKMESNSSKETELPHDTNPTPVENTASTKHTTAQTLSANSDNSLHAVSSSFSANEESMSSSISLSILAGMETAPKNTLSCNTSTSTCFQTKNSAEDVDCNGSTDKSVNNNRVRPKIAEFGDKRSPGVTTVSADSELKDNCPDDLRKAFDGKILLPRPPSFSSTTSKGEPPKILFKTENSSILSSDSSWHQLKNIASLEEEHCHGDLSAKNSTLSINESTQRVQPELSVPTPKNKRQEEKEAQSSPEDQDGIKENLSRTSSLSNSPTNEEMEYGPSYHDVCISSNNRSQQDAPSYPCDSIHGTNTQAMEPSHSDVRSNHRPALPMPLMRSHYAAVLPAKHHFTQYPDENSPSESTISTKDTRSFFPAGNITTMKPKHPVHLKTYRDESNARGNNEKRRKIHNSDAASDTNSTQARMPEDPKSGDDISPANASSASEAHSSGLDIHDLGIMHSWDTNGKSFSAWSICSGMTGVESLMNRDLNNETELSAFSFVSEVGSRKDGNSAAALFEGREEDETRLEKEVSPSNKSILSRGKRKISEGLTHHVQFSQEKNVEHHSIPIRKRMHMGMPPPPHPRYPIPDNFYSEIPPSQLPPPAAYDYLHTPPPIGRYPSQRFHHHYHREHYPQDEYYDYSPDHPHYIHGPPPNYDLMYARHAPPFPRSRDYHRGPQLPHPHFQYQPEYSTGTPHGQDHAGSNVINSPPPVVHSQILVPNPRALGTWPKEDDLILMDIMKKHKNIKNWESIAKKLDRGKSAKECQDRWTRFLKPGSRKGQWTEAEDRIVVEAVSNSIEDPFTRWSDLAQQLPGRVGKQVRDRWVNHLNPAINHLPFTSEDDLLLWEGHNSLGKRWVEISFKYFNSTRSENHIKNRWYSASFRKFITREFGPEAYKIGNEKGGSGEDIQATNDDSEGLPIYELKGSAVVAPAEKE